MSDGKAGEHSSLVAKATGGIAWSFLGAGGQTVANALVVVLLARLLTPEDFGVVGAALVIVNLTQVFMHFGVGPAIVQLESLTQSHIRVGFTLSVALGLLFAVLVYMAAPWLAGLYRMPELLPIIRVLALAFPISGAASVGRSLLQRNLKFRALALVELVSFVVGYGAVATIMALNNYGPWALVYGQIGQTVVSTLLVIAANTRSVGFAFRLAEAKQLLNFGTGITLASIFNYLATQTDNFIVGRYLGAEMLGLYSRAYQLLMLPTRLIGSVLDKVLFPVMASVQRDTVRLGQAFHTSIGVVILLTLPLSVALYVAAPQIVLVLLGDQWHQAVDPFRVLILFLVWRTAYKISDSMAKAVGAVYRRIWRQAVYFLMVAMGSLVGQQYGGITGVAWGVGIAVLVNFVLTLQLSMSLLGTPWTPILAILGRHALVATIVGSSVGAGLQLVSMVADSTIVELVGAVLFGLVAYIVLALGFPNLLGREGRFLHNSVAKRLRRSRD